MKIDEYIEESISNLQSINNPEFIRLISETAKLIIDSVTNSGNILVCGNGGSHSDAQHFAGELVNFFTRDHKALNVITLGTNSAVASAWSNDHSFEDQFAREVEAYGNSNSLLIGFTTSGKSKNVNNAFSKANSLGIKTLALTSKKALPYLTSNIDLIIPVPVNETHKIQELHIVIYHAICILVEENLPTNFLN
jgi:D-sedoheptulose 7-phosphate isomerase